MNTTKPSVLFVCVHNAGRSQMAAGYLRQLAGDRIEVRSAGSIPAEQINPVAVEAMREALNVLAIDGTVVIGEGERDKAPMLYIGEKVGTGGPAMDIALDPLEGTTICAKGLNNSMAVLAMTTKGGFLHAPDVYMDKIAVGGGLPENVVNLEDSVATNSKSVVGASRPASGVNGTSLGWLVELELVVGSDVSSAAILVGQDTTSKLKVESTSAL